MSTQPDAQRFCAAGQPPAHVPVEPLHAGIDAGQTLPQLPQFKLSKRRFTHCVPHMVEPPAQMHAPAEHVWLLGHTLPHAPQFALDEAMSVQIPPQLAEPVGHVQTPAVQF